MPTKREILEAAKRRRDEVAEAAKALNDYRYGRRAEASEAAARLARRLAERRGDLYMKQIASNGGRAAWASMTPLERRIELRRRAVVRLRKLAKRRQEQIVDFRRRVAGR